MILKSTSHLCICSGLCRNKDPSSSRAYCILAKLTNSNVLVKLAIRHLNNREIQEFLYKDQESHLPAQILRQGKGKVSPH